MAALVLWIYIILLLVGGLIGFLKAKSKISLYVSVLFAVALSLCATNILPLPIWCADILLAILLAVFAMRYFKTKKWMPAGMMLILTALTLLLRYLSK